MTTFNHAPAPQVSVASSDPRSSSSSSKDCTCLRCVCKSKLKRTFLDGPEPGTALVALDDPILLPLFEVAQETFFARPSIRPPWDTGFLYLESLRMYQVDKSSLEQAYDRMVSLLLKFDTRKESADPRDYLGFAQRDGDNFHLFVSDYRMVDAIERRVEKDHEVFAKLRLPCELKGPFQHTRESRHYVIPMILVVRALELLDQQELYEKERCRRAPEPIFVPSERE